jgi:hypothetical protein
MSAAAGAAEPGCWGAEDFSVRAGAKERGRRRTKRWLWNGLEEAPSAFEIRPRGGAEQAVVANLGKTSGEDVLEK